VRTRGSRHLAHKAVPEAFAVTLDHDAPGGEQISIHSREVTAAGKAAAGLPWLPHTPPCCSGEMIYPWMFGTDPALRPLRDAAELLAGRDSRPDLYDAARLRANGVPVAAAVYRDDMYMDREHLVRTAEVIRALRPWVTSEYEHDGRTAEGSVILARLIHVPGARPDQAAARHGAMAAQ
jgi:hypothetical protein